MSNGRFAAVLAEVGLLVVLAGLLAGRAGTSPAASAVAGVALMAALAPPSLLVFMWGRGRSNGEFMASVFGVLLAKMAVVGGGLLWVWTRTKLPPLPFALGLMGGWIASFAVQGMVLWATRKRPEQAGRGAA
jgi:hypothetical protein